MPAVAGGNVQLAGDAKIDDDKDGLLLSNFVVAWPENALRLGATESCAFATSWCSSRSTWSASTAACGSRPRCSRRRADRRGRRGHKFELDRLPQFAMPKDLELRGVLDANAVVQGSAVQTGYRRARRRPRSGRPTRRRSGGRRARACARAPGHAGDRWLVAGSGVLRLDFEGKLPVQAIAAQPPSTPVQFDARLAQLDLARLARRRRSLRSWRRGPRRDRCPDRGHWNACRAAGHHLVDARDVGTDKLQQVDARAGVLVEKGVAALDASLSLGGDPALGLTAQAPFDLVRALRDRTYLRGALTGRSRRSSRSRSCRWKGSRSPGCCRRAAEGTSASRRA